MRKYPVGEQDFSEIIKGGFVYVDKTNLIHTLIESGKYYFLSRPRRFGKSLLLSTIGEIFSGSKELFKGLWIENQWNWEKKHPVIHIRFSNIDYQRLGLYEALNNELTLIAKNLGVILEETYLKDKFRELIEKAATQENVVILIDDHDKPIIDYFDDLSKAEINRQVFKEFYSVLKDAGKYTRLLLITGVNQFPKGSIFSDLNNLNDITLNPKYATITGITQEELESNFAEEISAFHKSNPDILTELKTWYNGYSWHDGINKVYNPFSLLNFMDKGSFQNYCFQTETPTFLIRHLKQCKEYLPENLRFGSNSLNNFDIEHLSTGPLLFQTGYLTIKSYDAKSGLYELGYPNKEVEESLNDAVLNFVRK